MTGSQSMRASYQCVCVLFMASSLTAYSWGARPPSVNRLAGLIWLTYVLSERPFDAQFDADVRSFFADFYHVELSDQQLRRLVAR